MKNNKQEIQENEYCFPYHYIPQYKYGFTQTFNWSWGINYISTIEFILKKISNEKFDNLADIGCGDGRFVKELSEIIKGKEIIGFDNSQKAINIAKALNPDLNFKCLDILNKKLKKKFDILTLIEVLEHIPIRKCNRFIKELYNLLKKNGILFITVPHINKKLNIKHYQHFTLKTIENNFKNFFEIIEIHYFEKISKISSFFNKLLTNRLFILNNSFLKNIIYDYYKKKLFYSNEKKCGRIYIKLQKK